MSERRETFAVNKRFKLRVLLYTVLNMNRMD